MNRRTLLIGVGAALGVLLIWYFLLWSPRGAAIDKASKRREAAESQAQELQAELNRLQEAKQNEAALRAQVEELRQAIPDEPNLAQFILDTNDAATQSGIDFLSISPTPPTPPQPQEGPPPPAQIALSINVTGGYFQVLDFVNRLTDLTRIVVIDGLTVSPSAGQDLSVQITGRMFTTQAATTGGTATTTTTTTPGATTTTVPGAVTTTTAVG
jgi:Tfp pilus assembly protein PilO